jgi:hypothetical protein
MEGRGKSHAGKLKGILNDDYDDSSMVTSLFDLTKF